MLDLLDDRNGPTYNLAAHPHPRCWILASVPRSGSTLLCRTLWDLGDLGAPKEYLNPMQRRDWAVRFGSRAHKVLRGKGLGLLGRGSERGLRSQLDRVILRRTSPSGWFGLKVHWHHFRPVLTEWLRPTFVRIVRDDKLAQAVSWARALQTGQWAAHQSSGLPPIYSRRRIARCLRQIETQEEAWKDFFTARPAEALTLRYESLVDDLPGTIARVYLHLGEAPPARTIQPALRRQADALSLEWIARFQAGR